MIPDFQTVMRPILVVLSDEQDHAIGDVIERIADEFQLTAEERAERLPSGNAKRINDKVHWAVSHMFQAGLVARPSRGHVLITPAGRATLAQHRQRVDMKVLSSLDSYVAWRAKVKQPTVSDPVVLGAQVSRAVELPAQSPDELIGQAKTENRADVEAQLLTRALALSPAQFEVLVLAVLHAMGYGRSGGIEHSGKPGDGGIDGIISQDPLGLDRIYLQAKRYAPGHSVQRPDVQQFVGALISAQGDRGVFLTTSTFSSGAIAEAERVNVRIVLIDGTRLAQLMLRHGVGVRARATVVLHEVDEDFFEGV